MSEHVCPWWVGYLLISPLRRLSQNPQRILGPYLKPGTVALDVGCGMGFFSLEMARMVGPQGRIVCVDVQPRMIRALLRRASRAGLLGRIDARVCSRNSLGLEDLQERIDFALAFAVVHEVGDVQGFFGETRKALRPGGAFLLAEPRGHVSEKSFEKTLEASLQAGFGLVARPDIRRSRAALLRLLG